MTARAEIRNASVLRARRSVTLPLCVERTRHIDHRVRTAGEVRAGERSRDLIGAGEPDRDPALAVGSSSLQAGRSRSGSVTAIGAISLRTFPIGASAVAGRALGRRNLSRAGPSTGRC
jgi:hypothetical protein